MAVCYYSPKLKGKGGAADGDLPDLAHLFPDEGIGSVGNIGHQGKIGKAVLHGGEALLGKIIDEADADVGIFAAVLLQHPQQAAAQAEAAGRDMHHAALQALVGKDLILRGLDVFKGKGNMGIQLFPLRRQPHPLGRTEEQCAAQLGFQPPDDARDVRLIVVERGGGVGKTSVLCGVVKNAVAVIANIHKITSFMIGGIYEFCI